MSYYRPYVERDINLVTDFTQRTAAGGIYTSFENVPCILAV